MTSRDDGGSAFPRLEEYEVMRESGIGTERRQARGMTLRDYFAGQVIAQCQLTVEATEPPPEPELTKWICERFARRAYQIADAMLAERQK